MAPRGRKPKPDALKKLQGNPGKRKIAKAAQAQADATSPLGALAPPVTLTEAEREIWKTQVATLEHFKFVKPADLKALTRYVKFQALFEAVMPQVTAENLVELTVSDKVTMERVSKKLLVLIHLDKQLEKYDGNFGMNPAARQAMMSRLAAAPGLFDPQKPASPADAGAAKAAPVPASEPAPPPPARPASPVGFGRLN